MPILASLGAGYMPLTIGENGELSTGGGGGGHSTARNTGSNGGSGVIIVKLYS